MERLDIIQRQSSYQTEDSMSPVVDASPSTAFSDSEILDVTCASETDFKKMGWDSWVPYLTIWDSIKQWYIYDLIMIIE